MSGPGAFTSASGQVHPSTAGFRSNTSRPSHSLSHGKYASLAASIAGGVGDVDAFTPAMRDRQSRGKDPHQNASDLEDEDSDTDMQLRLLNLDNRDFATRERRNQAAAYLDNPELLMMYALSTGDSIPAARLHFIEMMCGFDEERPRTNPYRDQQRRRKPSAAPGGGSGASSDQSNGQKSKRRGGDRAAGR